MKWWEIALRLATAVAVGCVIGVEREKKNRPAGMRTHVLVCVGAALVAVGADLLLANGTTDMPDYPNEYIAVTKIRFKDGTEYLVRDDNTANYMFAVGNTGRDVTFLFNRMIDVNAISVKPLL